MLSPDRHRPPLPHVMDVSFDVEATPVAQPRARSQSLGGRPYVDRTHPIYHFKSRVQEECRRVYGHKPHYGPVVLAMQFLMPRPKIHGKKRRRGREPHVCRPDCDNLAKGVMDALNGLLWVDDQQVFCLSVVKLYCEEARHPGVVVEVELYDGHQPGHNYEVN